MRTNENGIYHVRENQVRTWAGIAAEYLKGNRIYCALQLKNGSYAIGTSHNGLLILDEQGIPGRSINKAMGLLNNSVLSMHEDQRGNLWLGLENGISHIEVGSPFSVIDSRLGVNGTAYSSMVYQDKLYLATNQGIFFQNWTNPPLPLSQDQFESVQNSKGATWTLSELGDVLIAGKHRGAFVINGDAARIISDIPGAWKFMVLEKHPHLAIGGTYTGLVLYEKDLVTSRWSMKYPLEGFQESSRVMEQDEQGNIWVSHAYRGVYRIQLNESGNRIQSVHFYNSQDGFPSDLSINVCRIQGEILFTTEKGVYRYDSNADSFVPHGKLNELLEGQSPVFRMMEDEIGNVWFSAGEEFGMLIIEDQMMEKKIRKLTINQLQNSLVKGFEHIYAVDEDHTFIGTDEGFILYNPGKVQTTIPELKTYIREVVATEGRDSLIFGGTFMQDGQLYDSQPSELIPEFPPVINDFRIVYSAAYFEDINTILYQYRLEGEEENWFSPGPIKQKKNIPILHQVPILFRYGQKPCMDWKVLWQTIALRS